MSTPRTLTVLPVPGHCVAVKEPDGTLVMGKFVGYGPDGAIRDRPVVLADTSYYREQIHAGALVEYVPPAETVPAVAAVAPTTPTETAPAEVPVEVEASDPAKAPRRRPAGS